MQPYDQASFTETDPGRARRADVGGQPDLPGEGLAVERRPVREPLRESVRDLGAQDDLVTVGPSLTRDGRKSTVRKDLGPVCANG
ncbi:hypothetical protein ACOT81_09890 [Streptomyces sp. WI04-05B]|uniref:hypothetical protein n=1 Tax=Streptomyces TaxID=1883 RepID=UPI0029BFBF1F|nr:MULTISPECIES: hypothetical protein [unclassified Streptomyces]